MMDRIKYRIWKLSRMLLAFKFPLLIELFKWLVVDAYRLFKRGKQLHIFGIWCFVGIYGGGKTMSLVQYLEKMRCKHKDNIYIATNFYYKNQDFEISTWKDLLPEYDKPVIFAYDELQNEFNSREYRSFPVSLMTLLTQNRKGNGKQIVYTAQDYETVDKNFRRLTKKVITCRTIAQRLTHTRMYDRESYEEQQASLNTDKRIKIRPLKSTWYVQSDYLRGLYDSYQMLESAKNKTYEDRIN